MKNNFDIAIIGAGPGGYVAAIRCAQLGFKVAIIEKRKALGGTCLNVGCIPSKALLDSSEHYSNTQHNLKEHGVEVDNIKLNLNQLMERKNKLVAEITAGVDFLMKKNKITRFLGEAAFVSSTKLEVNNHQEKVSIEAKNIIIATGSTPIELPNIPVDQKKIITSDQAIHLSKVPKSLTIIGAGVIGLELGSVWKRLGSDVTIVEFMPSLFGGLDSQMASYCQRIYEKQGLKFLWEHKVESASVKGKNVELRIKDSQQKDIKITSEIVLVAVGRKPVTENLNLNKIGVSLNAKHRIEVDPKTFQTNVPNIYAIGDVIDGPMLAHKASEEGVAVAEILAGNYGHVNYHAIPWVIYTWPEVAWVGSTEKELKEKNIPYKVGKSIFRSNGRAKAMNEVDGMVKILSHKQTDELLGAFIVGARASDMIAELAIAKEFHASAEDIARSVHAHPTLSEIIKEAAMDVDKWAIHG